MNPCRTTLHFYSCVSHQEKTGMDRSISVRGQSSVCALSHSLPVDRDDMAPQRAAFTCECTTLAALVRAKQKFNIVSSICFNDSGGETGNFIGLPKTILCGESPFLLWGVDLMAIRASGSASGHFRPVSSPILASLFFKVPFCLSTAPADCG